MSPIKPGHFGPAVIGEEAFEEERKLRETSAHVFGPGVLSTDPQRPVSHGGGPVNKVGDGVAPTAAEKGPELVTPADAASSPELEGDRKFPLPRGWTAKHVSGGYYDLFTPAGTRLENPEVDSGRWKGKEAAQAAALALYRDLGLLPSPEPEIEAEASEEDVDEADEADEPTAQGDGTTPEDPSTDPVATEAGKPEPTIEPTAEEIGDMIDGADGSDAAASIADLEAVLEKSPEAVDRLFAHEMNRPEGRPRKGAIEALISAEHDREGGARETMLEALEGALRALG